MIMCFTPCAALIWRGNWFKRRNQAWAKKLRKLLQTMCHRRAVLAAEGANAFPAEELDAYLRRYDELVEEGMAVHREHEKVPGKRGRVGTVHTGQVYGATSWYDVKHCCLLLRAYSNISVKSVADCDKIERSQEAEYGQEEKQRTE